MVLEIHGLNTSLGSEEALSLPLNLIVVNLVFVIVCSLPTNVFFLNAKS